jgi:hypothetical protein
VPLKGRMVAPLAMKDLKAFIAKRPVYTVMSAGKLTETHRDEDTSMAGTVREHVRASIAH